MIIWFRSHDHNLELNDNHRDSKYTGLIASHERMQCLQFLIMLVCKLITTACMVYCAIMVHCASMRVQLLDMNSCISAGILMNGAYQLQV